MKTLFEHNEIAPPEDATSCPSKRIPWAAYTENGRMYTDAQIDAKINALFFNAMQNGADILKNRALINEIAQAFFNHVQNHGSTSVSGSEAELRALIEKAQQAIDDLEERVVRAGEVLNGG